MTTTRPAVVHLSLGATSYNVNESSEKLTVTVNSSSATNQDISFEIHWGKATVIPTGDIAATSKDYLSKVNGAYPTGTIKAGTTSASVEMLIQRNLLAHPDEVATIHLTKVSPTTAAKALTGAKTATVIIHQDDVAATYGTTSPMTAQSVVAAPATISLSGKTPWSISASGFTANASGTLQYQKDGVNAGAALAITFDSTGKYTLNNTGDSFTALGGAGKYMLKFTASQGTFTSNEISVVA